MGTLRGDKENGKGHLEHLLKQEDKDSSDRKCMGSWGRESEPLVLTGDLGGLLGGGDI